MAVGAWLVVLPPLLAGFALRWWGVGFAAGAWLVLIAGWGLLSAEAVANPLGLLLIVSLFTFIVAPAAVGAAIRWLVSDFFVRSSSARSALE